MNTTNLSTTAMTFSFGIACIVLTAIIAFSTINAMLSCDTSDQSKSAFKEYFNGMKNTKSARMFNVVLMARRVILVVFMVCLNDINKVFLVLLSAFYQIAHTVFIIWVRPYEAVKDNLNEIMIDVMFSFMLVILMYFHTKDAWNEVVTEAYFYLLGFPGIFIFVSSLGKCL